MQLLKRRPRSQRKLLSIFFATDLHGSNVCFRKFLNARAAYDVDALVLGGDLTGKLAIPIVRSGGDDFVVYAPEGTRRVDAPGLQEIRQMCSRAGFYPFFATDEELANLRSDPSHLDSTLDRLRCDRIREWAGWAEDKLARTSIHILVAPGNDDPVAIDGELGRASRFDLAEKTVRPLLDDHPFEILSTGVSNVTPWKTHREMSEDALKDHLEALAERVDDPRRAIFNIHVPPYRSTLDNGPVLDLETLKIKSGAQEMTVPVGSRACRDVLERYQPMLSLHGHIHESRGVVHIGRTLAINPGSDYGDGILRGAIVRLDPTEGVVSHQLTSG